MDSYIIEWLSLLFRWIHVIAAIAWIGHAFMFHSFEHSLRPPEGDDVPDGLLGEVRMVHGGGFFHLQKTRVLPPGFDVSKLKWFKWEAGLTWLSGVILLFLVFYMGGGVYLIDPSVANISPGTAIAIGVSTMVGGWVLYDLIWSSRLRTVPVVPMALTLLMIAGATYGLSQVLSGRAAFIHVGGLLGTLMAANVWMRILPNSRRMVDAIARGEAPDLTRGDIGRQRSLHNGYMHFPVIFIMISNHFPATYAHGHAWLVLLLIMALGACMRQVLYDGFVGAPLVVKGTLAGSALGLVVLTVPMTAKHSDEPVPVATGAAQPIDPATVGTIRGVVSFEGALPAPQPLTLWGGCESVEGRPAVDNAVLVKDGRLANAFVWIRQGHEDWQAPPPPTEEVALDQRACIYAPRVIGARVGQPITFINSDPLFHNVRSVSEANSVFNLNMPAKDQRITRTFKRPEIMIQARCDVHPWMRAYIGVVPHPWFAITGETGAFTLEGVPPGRYVVEAWHEVFGTRVQEATVDAQGTATVAFTFAGAGDTAP